MPKWEDGPLLITAGRHPAACTCQDCANRFLKGRNIESQRDNRTVDEKFADYKANRGMGRFLKRLFRLKRAYRSK